MSDTGLHRWCCERPLWSGCDGSGAPALRGSGARELRATSYELYDARMSSVVFGAIVGFAIYAMAHFLHEWFEASRTQDDAPSDP